MNPKSFTFDKSPSLPQLGEGPHVSGPVDVVRVDGELRLTVTDAADFPEVVHLPSGRRGRLVRAVTSDIKSFPELGKVTIKTEQFIWMDDGKRYGTWKPDDFKFVEPPPITGEVPKE